MCPYRMPCFYLAPCLSRSTLRSVPAISRLRSPGRLGERILAQDGLVPIGAGGDDGDRYAHQRLKALEIGAGIGRQFLVSRNANGALLPARMLFVHRLGGPEMFGQQRRSEHGLAIYLITHTDLDGVQPVQHVEL